MKNIFLFSAVNAWYAVTHFTDARYDVTHFDWRVPCATVVGMTSSEGFLVERTDKTRSKYFYSVTHMQRICTARYMLWQRLRQSVCSSVCHSYCVSPGTVVFSRQRYL